MRQIAECCAWPRKVSVVGTSARASASVDRRSRSISNARGTLAWRVVDRPTLTPLEERLFNAISTSVGRDVSNWIG